MEQKKKIRKRAENVVKSNLKNDGYRIMDRIGDEEGLPDLLAGRDQHLFLVHINPAAHPFSPKELTEDEEDRMKFSARKLKAFPCRADVKLNSDLSVMDLIYIPIK